MTGLSISAPPSLPVPAARLLGRVLRVPAGACRYRDDALVLLVRRVRLDISQWYGGLWVWLEGDELAADGFRLRRTQALVHVATCSQVAERRGA